MVKGRSEHSQALIRFLGVVFGLTLLIPSLIFLKADNSFATPSESFSQQRRPRSPQTKSKQRIDYRNFTHSTHVNAQKLECTSCHSVPTKNWKDVRKGDAAFPDVAEFPEHSTCLNCHRQQFFARERPAPSICSNCHVNVTPRDTTRFIFPSLGDVVDASRPRRDRPSEFVVNFSHEIHLEVVNARTSGPERRLATYVRAAFKSSSVFEANCSVCHRTYTPQGDSSEEYVTKPPKNLDDAFWLKKGTFKTIPNSHTVCFTCHNADSGIMPTSAECQACHHLPTSAVPTRDFDPSLIKTMGITDSLMVKEWSRRISSGAFRHEGGAHPDLECTLCHRPADMTTTEPATLKVPVRSCGGGDGCHITATADDGGILNYEIEQKKADPNFVCTKCHITFGKQPTPAGHLESLPAPQQKKPALSGF